MNFVRDWLEFQRYKRHFRKTRLWIRRKRHQVYMAIVIAVYRLGQRLVRWTEPRIRQHRPEILYPVRRDRYSRDENRW